jgi:hypothetical protein
MRKYMFQYATQDKIIEDTWLITRIDAFKLRDKYIDDCKKRIEDWESPQMCIWWDCNSTIDYSVVIKEIDSRECILENWKIYKVSKELIN